MAMKIGKFYITRNNPRELLNIIKDLKEENQELKKMQCTWLGTGCQAKMKEYKSQQKEFIEYFECQVKLQEELNNKLLATGFEEVLEKYKKIIRGGLNNG